MSTPAMIQVPGVNAGLYKHFNGYPENTLPWLKKFNKDFTERRGDDPSYKFAQLIRSSVRMQEEFNLDADHYTGWGVVNNPEDWDPDFRYILEKDGSVTIKGR